MLGNAPKAMQEHRRGASTPQGRPSGSPSGRLLFVPRFVDAPW